MDNLKAVMQNKVSRRRFIRGVSAGVGVAASVSLASGCSSNNSVSAGATPPTPPTNPSVTDADILNFALNLEYLEASFYLYATTGSGLTAADMGKSPGKVTGGSQVAFKTPAIQQYAMEIAADELAHVRFLRTALGASAVDMPDIDLQGSFNAAAMAAGIGPAFNPFDNENDFILGAFVFEDVGVTAYHGAAPLLQTLKSKYLAPAAGILATEAYHAGEIRTILAYLGEPYLTTANKISDLRGKASAAVAGGSGASGAAEVIVSPGSIVPSDSNSIAFDRSTDQVLHIVYLNATAGAVTKGGFFPTGLKGTITASAS